eukprot:TRINITY_DN7258_c2_g1_i2.p1 TRINITY_DN7258_c2_g1~~TRINITY_DN7258_c2_g1_i2.p1  ORF type:complete len:167 (-),score=18.53 TRINITY_DN7258_c2_g1_i2:315-815(-)
MEFFPDTQQFTEFRDYTLVLPALSIGNIGQMAIDLLIVGLKMKKVGLIDSPYALPMAGNNAFTEDGSLTTAVEVFASPEHKIAVIQQRAPAIKRYNEAFASNLIDFYALHGFKELILLNSTEAIMRRENQLSGYPRKNCILIRPQTSTPICCLNRPHRDSDCTSRS